MGFLLLIIFILLSTEAFGHKPLDTSGPATRSVPVNIREHQISRAAYNSLRDEKDVHYYKLLSVKKGERIYASIYIPRIERLKDFSPILGLIGPGLEMELDDLNKELVEELLEIYPGEGVILKKNEKKAKNFFEPFTQTNYWEKQQLELVAPVDGDYYLVVFDPAGKGDKYLLSIGEKESWGLKDLGKFPAIWWKVRVFAEKKISTYVITGFVLLGFCYLFYYIIKRLY